MRSDIFWVIRTGVLGTVATFSVITLGLGAAYISKVHSFSNAFVTFTAPAFAGLAVAISVITMLALPALLAVDFIRRGAVTSWIAVELGVVGLLSILWLATAADTAAASLGLPLDCSVADQFSSTEGMLCHTYQGVEAFSFINWLLLKGYVIMLLVVTLISYSRGNKGVFQSTVRDTDFFARPQGTNVAMMAQPKPLQAQYGTPVPQQYGTPSPGPQQYGVQTPLQQQQGSYAVQV